MAESTVATLGLIETLRRLPVDAHVFFHNHLGNALAVGNGKGFVRKIDHNHAYFAPVIGIDSAGGIYERDAFFRARPLRGRI